MAFVKPLRKLLRKWDNEDFVEVFIEVDGKKYGIESIDKINKTTVVIKTAVK